MNKALHLLRKTRYKEVVGVDGGHILFRADKQFKFRQEKNLS